MNLSDPPRLRQAPPIVTVARGTSADSAAAILKTALDGLGGIARFVKPGQVVAIKPNATWAFPPHTASSTDPELLTALIRLVAAAGARRILVIDHCSIDPGAAEALRISGIGKALEKLDVEPLFFDRNRVPKNQVVEVALPSGRAFTRLNVFKAAVEADVRINLAVAKCHTVTRVTMTMKHMMGFLSEPGNLHTRLEQGIADLNSPSAIAAHLSILEAVRVRHPQGNYRVSGGFDTDLTDPKVVRRVNQVVAGTDPVLIDAYGCGEYFGIKPNELAHVRFGAEIGVGESDVAAAQASGRLRFFRVGEPLATPTSTAAPAATLTSTPPPAAAQPPAAAVSPAAVSPTAASPTAVSPTAASPTAASPTAASPAPPAVPAAPPPAAAACEPSEGFRWLLNPALLLGSLILAALSALIARRMRFMHKQPPD